MNSPDELMQVVSSFPIDRHFVLQEKLDIRARERTSLYPWRGQFSPGLVDLFLDIYAKEGTVVLDPFAGSGTTLFEATRRGHECYGAEINPAAVQLASMVRFTNLDEKARREIFDLAEQLLEKYIGGFLPPTLFTAHVEDTIGTSINAAVEQMLNEAAGGFTYELLASSVMLAMGDGATLEAETLLKAYARSKSIVSKLWFSPHACNVFLADARNLSLPKSSVDLVITSPPYINVFNYHQNYRKAMELMGWRLLEVAPSEIGSNRKHRGNRFMTVVQYCMDMVQTLTEIERILRPEGIFISVIGRESRVRGIPFHNGQLLALCAIGGSGFNLERWQERRFTNRFGKIIYEDVLTLRPNCGTANGEEFGRRVGVMALENALHTAEGEIRVDIEQAIMHSEAIQPSRRLVASLLKANSTGILRA
ncbi:MAG: DNA methyltransferase [Rubrobacteraceae bacterium]